jgi:hypothetical protein
MDLNEYVKKEDLKHLLLAVSHLINATEEIHKQIMVLESRIPKTNPVSKELN